MGKIVGCFRLLANIVSRLSVMVGIDTWLWKRSYHKHASMGLVRIRHRRSIPCWRVDRWASELDSILRYVLGRSSSEIPSLLFTVEESLPPTEEGETTYGEFISEPLEIRLAVRPEGVYREAREYCRTLAQEVHHLIHWFFGGEVDYAVPYRLRTHEAAARIFAANYAANRLRDLCRREEERCCQS